MFQGSCARHVVVGLVVAAGSSVGAFAQTISDGTATFQMLTPAFATTLGDATLRNEGVASPDIQYKYCWYYRTEVSSTNTVMSKWDTPTAYTQGNQTRLTWTNAGPGVAGLARFNAELVLRLRHGPGLNQTRLFSKMTFQSAADSPRLFNLFHLADLDMPGGTPNAATDDRQAFNSNTGVATFSETSSVNVGRLIAADYQAFDVASGSVLRAELGSGSGSLFDQTQYSGDGAAAYQWAWTLQSGETKVVRVGQSFNASVYLSDPCDADLTRDNAVDDADFVQFVAAYENLLCPSLPAFCDADLNEDGVVDDADFTVFAAQYDALLCAW
ncbi:MAG: hypothetical protein JNK16_02725 [Phycisphaerales bacterium]|nr:hypothetical protein [Phycisphaerales bacterium]